MRSSLKHQARASQDTAQLQSHLHLALPCFKGWREPHSSRQRGGPGLRVSVPTHSCSAL